MKLFGDCGLSAVKGCRPMAPIDTAPPSLPSAAPYAANLVRNWTDRHPMSRRIWRVARPAGPKRGVWALPGRC
jgi:hypothetical protein